MIRAAVVTLCSAALVAGCGSGSSNSLSSHSTAQATSSAPATPATTAPAPGDGPTVRLLSSAYGQILADRRGQAFYRFGKENMSRSECYGACANKWPPVLVTGKPHAGPGGQSRLLGTTHRRDGKLQLTYAGHPMYYYEGDTPGRVLCQGVNEFGGPWLVVRQSGKPVR